MQSLSQAWEDLDSPSRLDESKEEVNGYETGFRGSGGIESLLNTRPAGAFANGFANHKNALNTDSNHNVDNIEADEVLGAFDAAWRGEVDRRTRVLGFASAPSEKEVLSEEEVDAQNVRWIASQGFGLPDESEEDEEDLALPWNQDSIHDIGQLSDYDSDAELSQRDRYTLDEGALGLLVDQPRPNVTEILSKHVQKVESRRPENQRPNTYVIPGEDQRDDVGDESDGLGMNDYGEEYDDEMAALAGNIPEDLDVWNALNDGDSKAASYYLKHLERERRRIAELELQREARKKRTVLLAMAKQLKEQQQPMQGADGRLDSFDDSNVSVDAANLRADKDVASHYQPEEEEEFGDVQNVSESLLRPSRVDVALRKAVLEDKAQNRIWSVLMKDRLGKPVISQFRTGSSTNDNITNLLSKKVDQRDLAIDRGSVNSVLAQTKSKRQRAVRDAILAATHRDGSAGQSALSTAIHIRRDPREAADRSRTVGPSHFTSHALEAMGALGYLRPPDKQDVWARSRFGKEIGTSNRKRDQNFVKAASRYDARIAAANFHGFGLENEIDEGVSNTTFTSQYPISPRELAHLLRLPSGGRAVMRASRSNLHESPIKPTQPRAPIVDKEESGDEEQVHDEDNDEDTNKNNEKIKNVGDDDFEEDSDDGLRVYGSTKQSIHNRLYGLAAHRAEQQHPQESSSNRNTVWVKPKFGPYSTVEPPLFDKSAPFRDLSENFKRKVDTYIESYKEKQKIAAEEAAETKRLLESGARKPVSTEDYKASAHIQALAKPVRPVQKLDLAALSSASKRHARDLPDLPPQIKEKVNELHSKARGAPSTTALQVEQSICPFAPSTTWRDYKPPKSKAEKQKGDPEEEKSENDKKEWGAFLHDNRNVFKRLSEQQALSAPVIESLPRDATFRPFVPAPMDRTLSAQIDAYSKMDVVERIQAQAEQLEYRREMKKNSAWPYNGAQHQFKALPVPLSVLAPRKPLHERKLRQSRTTPSKPSERDSSSTISGPQSRIETKVEDNRVKTGIDIQRDSRTKIGETRVLSQQEAIKQTIASPSVAVVTASTPSITEKPILNDPSLAPTLSSSQVESYSQQASDKNGIFKPQSDVNLLIDVEELTNIPSTKSSIVLPEPSHSLFEPLGVPNADSLQIGPLPAGTSIPFIETFGPEALDELSSARGYAILPARGKRHVSYWDSTQSRSRRVQSQAGAKVKLQSSTPQNLSSNASQLNAMSDLAVYLKSMSSSAQT